MNEFKKKSLALAVGSALGLGATVMPGMASAQDQEAGMLEEVVVTGSRIKRTEGFAQGSQVVVLDEQKIAALGTLQVADVLRSSPLNTLGSFNERSGSSAQSNASVDLRGLGSERTLVMLNSRRLSGSPNQGAASININMLPMAAVERIDILADGGSATYGSDAVAGVVNMVLKSDFEGLEISYRQGDRDRDSGGEESISVILGAKGERAHAMLAAEWNVRDPIFDADRDFTAGSWPADPNLYVNTTGVSYYGKTIWLYDPTTGFDQTLAANGCAEGAGFIGVADFSDVWGGNQGGDTACGYAYANVSANRAKLDRYNTWASGGFDITDDIEFYVEGLFSEVESFGRYAPPAAAWPDMPADYRDNPFDIDSLLASGAITDDYSLTGFYRWTNIGPRDNYVTDTQYDFAAGFRGDATENLSFDTYLQYDEYKSKEFGYYYLSYPGLDYVLNNGLDPFSPEGAGAMSATTTQDNETKLWKAYGHVQYDFGNLTGGGNTYVLAGLEYFEQEYVNLYDRASEFGFVGGSAGNSSAGQRDVTAAFAEALVPVTDTIEVNVAVRYDDYSDFGDEISPSISGTWRAMDNLTVRARWSEGFRAPAMDQLYGPVTFSAEDAIDYVKCQDQGVSFDSCPTRQVDTYFSTSEDLDAETSESFSLGVNWEFIDGWTTDIAWWNVQVDDVIVQWSPQDVIFGELAGNPSASDPSDGNYVDRSGGQTVVYASYANAAELDVEGIDWQINGIYDTSIGAFSLSYLWSHQLAYEETAYYGGSVTDVAGYNLQPEDRMQAIFGWSWDRHAINLVWDYIGEHSEGDFVDPDSGQLKTSSDNLDDWSIWNANYSLSLDNWGTIKLGVNNLTDEDPVLDKNGEWINDHYDLYDATGRVYYFEYRLSL